MSMLVDAYRFGGGGGGGSFASEVLALSPWGYWKLDETGTLTNAADSSGNGRTGTYSGTGTTGGASGLFGGSSSAITLDGNGRVDFPTMGSAFGQKISCLACFQTTASGAFQHIISSDDNINNRRNWQWTLQPDGLIRIVMFPGASVDTNIGSAYNDGNPHMGVIVFDPDLVDADGQLKAYVDGSLVFSSTSSRLLNNGTDTRPAFGSRSSELQAEPMIGNGDECALWYGRALTAGEVAALWAARNTP